MKTLAADYLVVGAGAAGMAFVDALIDNADVSVVIIDRRHGPGGHWLDDYPFVRLHQASAFYGVASTLLGGARIQADGPEVGLHERASAAEICSYYRGVLDRFTGTGKVTFYPNTEYLGDGRFSSRLSGQEFEMQKGCRIVDARYLSPDIPSCSPAPFGATGARVIPVNDLVRIADAPSEFVIAGSGKTATDACIWLLSNGVDPDQIRWIRPREPWMLNRAVVQPDPAIFIGMGARTMELAASAADVDELFFGMEEAGIMMRIDPSVTPTMAKTPTVAQWELDLLRTIENVVRLGHIKSVTPTRIDMTHGELRIAPDAVVVHCAASGLRYQALVPVWRPDSITLQPVRTGFPCFGAAVSGYVEATRDDDGEKNRVCLSSPFPDSPTDWARMQVLGSRASAAFSREPDINAWAHRTYLNPGRIPPERAADADVVDAVRRFGQHAEAGIAKLDAFSRADTFGRADNR